MTQFPFYVTAVSDQEEGEYIESFHNERPHKYQIKGGRYIPKTKMIGIT